MIKYISFLSRYLIFWLLLFNLQLILFLLLGLDQITMDGSDSIWAFLFGMRMNIAASCFLFAIPILMLIALFLGIREWLFQKILKLYTYFLCAICIVVFSADIGLYKAWGTKFNAKAFAYLQFPKEVFPLIFDKSTLFIFPLILLQIFICRLLYKNIFKDISMPVLKPMNKILIAFFAIVLCIIGARGGTQKIPLNRNQIFYSNNQLFNYAAMNSFWNFSEVISKPAESIKNPYQFYSDSLALGYFKNMLIPSKDTCIQILNTDRPNIVLVFLESWTADLIECLGGEKNVTPHFTQLAKEGILFSEFYSTGYRTEQGLLAMLSAFPAQPQGSPIYSWGKFDKLPNLFSTFDSLGYNTSFYYGGRLQFDNVEAYLRSGGVQKMFGENDFKIKKRTPWGAYDDEIFNFHLSQIKNEKQPFFTMLGTITTHEWWDADVPQVFKNSNDKISDKFRNTMTYADNCLFRYIQNAKNEDWYNNTLFVLVADHGCRFPLKRNNYEVKRHHIPMLLMGGALKKEMRGIVNNHVASHTDLAATLLAQIKVNAKSFFRSKNIFNPYANKFAYYTFDNGFGFITKEKSVIFDNYRGHEINNMQDKISDSLLLLGKSYLQCSNSFVLGQSKGMK